MTQPTPIYVVCSPRPHVGKTLIARLLLNYFVADDRSLLGFDLHPREPGLARHFPDLVNVIDLADTPGEIALFDRLIADDLQTKVVDLGYDQFERFFDVMWEIGFIQEARRRRIEPILLFVADPSPATIHAYWRLRRRFAMTAIVPVHNEYVSCLIDERDFPPTRAEGGVIRMPPLSPIVRGVIDRPSFSFGAYVDKRRGGGPTEIHQWVATIFLEFRQIELRLLLGKLSASLAPPMRRSRG